MVKNLEALERLQTTCAEVFSNLTARLEVGMSELEIAEQFEKEFRSRGITKYWYDVPFNVLIGTDRFVEGLTTADYTTKRPSPKAVLRAGDSIYIDFAPIDPITRQWGDWSSTLVFHPRGTQDDEQVAFLEEMRIIQREGIAKISSQTTGAEVANYYLDRYRALGVTLLDVRNNVGHSLHDVPKSESNRIWLDTDNNQPLGEGLFTVEPGGSRPRVDGQGIVVARFEVSIYIPKSGQALILGEHQLAPLII